jgi:hypothetical protein
MCHTTLSALRTHITIQRKYITFVSSWMMMMMMMKAKNYAIHGG